MSKPRHTTHPVTLRNRIMARVEQALTLGYYPIADGHLKSLGDDCAGRCLLGLVVAARDNDWMMSYSVKAAEVLGSSLEAVNQVERGWEGWVSYVSYAVSDPLYVLGVELREHYL